MRTVLVRAVALAAALLVVLPVAAGAAVDDYAAEASTTTVQISLFEEALGAPLLGLVSTDAVAVSDPAALASVGTIELLGEQVLPLAEAGSDGEPSRDPAQGPGCLVPLDVQGLTLHAVCAVALADAGASDEARANASADLLEVDVNGSLVSGLLTAPLGTLLQDLTDDIADGAVADAIAMLTDACNQLLDTLNGQGIPDNVSDLLDMLPPQLTALLGIIGGVTGSEPCTAIINLTINSVTAPVIDLQPLADALADVNLVQLKVGGVSSDVTGGDAAMTATATQATVELTGPSLGFLDDTILALLDSLGQGLLDTILTIAGQPGALDGFDITGQIQAVLDQIPLLESDQPLIAAEVFGGRATATLDNRDASTTAGGDPPYVELTIAPAVLELLGQDPESGTVRLEAGDSLALPIAGGTPLESTISVGSVTTQDGVTLGDTGLTGSTANASLTTVSLLNIPGVGGIDITLAAASAEVYGAMDVVADPAPAPAPAPDPLPRTGGGVAVGAVLALGTALALRRRRD